MELFGLINIVYSFIILIAAIFLSVRKNKEFLKKHPTLHPYKYGYWCAYTSYLCIPLSIISFVEASMDPEISNGTIDEKVISLAMVALLFLVFSWMYWVFARAYMNRCRWPWVLSMAFLGLAFVGIGIYPFVIQGEFKSLDVYIIIGLEITLAVFFILHFIYLKKRWPEMGKKNAKFLEPTEMENK